MYVVCSMYVCMVVSAEREQEIIKENIDAYQKFFGFSYYTTTTYSTADAMFAEGLTFNDDTYNDELTT